jgi:hypothetical protein
MIADKYGNYARKFMRQPRGWGRVDICMALHKGAFDFFSTDVQKVSVHCIIFSGKSAS